MSAEVLKRVTNYVQYNVIEESMINPKILKMFENLKFKAMKLLEIDMVSLEFKRLKVLDLSNNLIEVLENTPPNLEELYLNYNRVNFVRGPINTSLLHLGLSYNSIGEKQLDEILRFYPKLFSLNIGHNKLIHLKESAEICSKFSDLKVLVLRGNPCVLVEGYKPYCIYKISNLRLFDNSSIHKDEAKKKKSMKSEKHTVGMGNISLNNDISFDLNISVLGGVEGVKLIEEHFEDPAIFEALEPKQRSSNFWIQTEFLEKMIISEVKLWDENFMKEEENGKTDFKISKRYILKLIEEQEKQPSEFGEGEEDREDLVEKIPFSNSIYNSLLDGLWIELYEEYPMIEEIENEEGDKISRAVLVDGKPRFKTAIRGITKISTENWLLNPNLNSSDLIIENKFYFYKLKYKNIPEFFYENHNISMKQSEVEAIDTYVKAKKEKMALQEQEDKEKAAAEKVRV